MRLFHRLLAVAMIAMVLEDVFNGAWGLHAGDLFPFRHLDSIPLYSPAVLVIEWLVTLLAASLLLAGRSRPGAIVGLAVTAIALSQRFSNHRCLLLVVLFFLLFDEESHAPTLLRVQLILVYWFSALNKITAGFLGGQSLTNLFAAHSVSWMPAKPLSWLVVLLELGIPFLLLWRPRAGLTVQIAMHLAFAIVMPGVTSFGLLMVALGSLYAVQESSR